jgi:putative hydrolase of the HAD superfamily
VSNFYGNLNSILEREDLLSFFSVVADSGKVGFSKPSPEIFFHAMNAMHSTPNETWMVGDSVSRDMKGAEQIGLSHIWLREEHAADAPPCCERGLVLNSFEKIESCLESVSLH